MLESAASKTSNQPGRVLLICGVIPLRALAEAGLLPIADAMSARSTAPVPSLWNTRNKRNFWWTKGQTLYNGGMTVGIRGAHFWLSSTVEAARNRLELALGRKQPSTTNHLGLKNETL